MPHFVLARFICAKMLEVTREHACEPTAFEA